MSKSSLSSKGRSRADKYDRNALRERFEEAKENREAREAFKDESTSTLPSIDLDALDERLGFPRITKVC